MMFSTAVDTLSLIVVLVLYRSPALLAQTNTSGSAFNCPPLEMSDGTPTSVHRLRPSDISVIGAMGDSITAGFGVLSNLATIYTEFTEFRGLSWSIGGDGSLPYVTTLPNILREYNPDLYGYSTGTTFPFDFTARPNTRFNVAESGAVTSSLLRQAQNLVEKIRESEDVDFDNDWKLVTVYIGGNDVCKDACISNDTVEDRIGDVAASLDYLSDNLPRTFVNLVQIVHIGDFQSAIVQSSYSQICLNFFSVEICPCGEFGQLSLGEQFEELIADYRQGIQDLADMYADSDTFTVVFQPYQTDVEFADDPDAVLEVSAVDCSHLSPEGNRQFAIGLWNNMLERVGEKSTVSRLPITEISCPTNDEPFLFTAQNSMRVAESTVAEFPVAGTNSLHSSLGVVALTSSATALYLIMKTMY